MNTVSATTARNNLYELIEEASMGKKIAITNKGETKAILISAEELASWEATMEVISDPELMEGIKEAKKDIKAGRIYNWEEVKKELQIEDVQGPAHKSSQKRSKKIR